MFKEMEDGSWALLGELEVSGVFSLLDRWKKAELEVVHFFPIQK